MTTSRIDLIRIKALEDAVEALTKAVAELQAKPPVAQAAQSALAPGISRNPKRVEHAQL